jgi:hypothetical protein
MRASLAALALLALATTALASDEPPAAPTPDTSPPPPPQALKLHLNEIVDLRQERGHAEFDLGLRQEFWKDPMVRLAYGISREQASQMRGGPVPLTATNLLITMPSADLRRVLAGPFARDWSDLTTEEKIGRITESAVYWSLAIAILSSLHRP